VSTSRLSKDQLKEYADGEELAAFKLNLDDPILREYYLIKVRLKNEGIALGKSLKIHASIGEKPVKILDIKYKVAEPHHKILTITQAIPSLTWSLDEYAKSEHCMSWIAGDPDEVKGYNIYRSLLKDAGYGRFNENLVTQNEYPLRSQLDQTHYFYSIESVGYTGLRSGRSTPLPIPEMNAFLPLFEDVIWIQPNLNAKKPCSGSKATKYHSLAEAMKKEGNATTFVIDERRENAINLSNLTNDNDYRKINVLYLEDLEFLRGDTDLRLTSGLDENAEIIVYFLCKTLPGVVHDLDLALDGEPEIKLERHGVTIKNNSPLQDKNADEKTSNKIVLTPSYATFYLGEHTIYLVWEYSESQPYKGVRIFRSERQAANDVDLLGQEIYEGPGSANSLDCGGVVSLEPEQKNAVEAKKLYPDIEPPPRHKGGFVPAPPSGLSITYGSDVSIPSEKSGLVRYLADDKVSVGLTYTYTIYVYDNKDRYSYPIVVNASLNDYSSNQKCQSVDVMDDHGDGMRRDAWVSTKLRKLISDFLKWRRS
jgi:hypothetical protein